MLVRDALEIIRFNTSTLDELSGKSINTLFSNRNIVQQLTYSLDKYAIETQGIEGIYSFPLNTLVQSVPMPPLALRTKTYRLILLYIAGFKYLLDVANLSEANANFRFEYSAIPRWVMPWEDNLDLFPSSSTSYNTTLTTSALEETDTTIPVVSTNSFLIQNGRFTIGTEVIKYSYVDSTHFYGCSRGQEGTTAARHTISSPVNENNCWIYYLKKHFRIPIYGDSINEATLNRQMEVPDEHMQIITDYTTYILLSKISSERATPFKVNFDEWLERTKDAIMYGRSLTKSGSGEIRSPFWYETGNPFSTFI